MHPLYSYNAVVRGSGNQGEYHASTSNVTVTEWGYDAHDRLIDEKKTLDGVPNSFGAAMFDPIGDFAIEGIHPDIIAEYLTGLVI